MARGVRSQGIIRLRTGIIGDRYDWSWRSRWLADALLGLVRAWFERVVVELGVSVARGLQPECLEGLSLRDRPSMTPA
jgi:hypothetical protein